MVVFFFFFCVTLVTNVSVVVCVYLQYIRKTLLSGVGDGDVMSGKNVKKAAVKARGVGSVEIKV